MGILEGLAAMSIGKLILLGVLALIVGIPALVLLIAVIIAPVAIISNNPPWGQKSIRGERMKPQIRTLGWGIFFIAFGAGILAAVALNLQFWGIAGIALLFGGISLIIFYFIAAKSERRTNFLKKDEEEAL